MKKLRRYLASLLILAGLLLAAGGAGVQGVWAARTLQDRSIVYQYVLMPPMQVCKDETYPVLVFYIRENFTKPGEVYAYSDAGTLSPNTWSVPAGNSYTVLGTSLTMKNLGKKEISYYSSNTAGAAPDITWKFEVLDCNYTFKLEAYAKAGEDLAEWYMYVSGETKFSSQTWASLVGNPGTYTLLFSGEITDEKLASGSEGLGCELAGRSFARGSFQVVGAGTDSFVLKIIYDPVEFGEGVVFHCLDAAGQESVVPLFENQTVNPGDSLPTDASFTGRVATYTFPFGETGKGTYTLIRRGTR